jgi:hypothetical protein
VRYPALRSRDFRLLLAGQAISLTGTKMQQVAVVWQLYLLTHSPLRWACSARFASRPSCSLRSAAEWRPTRSTAAS